MAAPPDNHPGSLQCQTWTLRVQIHCEGCKKKVKKILMKIEGVYMTTVDAQQHKVVVTGNVDAETLLKRLSKSGKPAELWAGNSVKTEKLQQLPDMEKAAAKEGGGQKPKSAEEGSLKTQKSSADKFDIPENDLNPPKPDGGKPPELEKGDQVNGTSSEGNGGKKKKKKSKGPNGNSGIDENSVPPSPLSAPAPTPSPDAPVSAPATMTAPAPGPMSATAPVQADAPAGMPGLAETIAPKSAAGIPVENMHMPAAGPHKHGPGPAPVELPAMPPMDQSRPMEPINLGPPANIGSPNHQGPPYEPCHGPANNFGPMDQPNYPYPRPHRPPPQLGVSYSMAQPSLSASYYAPPYYSYEYPQHPMMHAPPPPPPSYPISDAYNDDRYYNDDNASQCRLM